MSYCRWSSDNYNCDIYAYESCYGGYEIHIASSKYEGEIPKLDYNLLATDMVEFTKQRKAQLEYLKDCGTKELNLKYAGENLGAETLEEFENLMLELKEIGYDIPDYVFETIKLELSRKQ